MRTSLRRRWRLLGAHPRTRPLTCGPLGHRSSSLPLSLRLPLSRPDLSLSLPPALGSPITQISQPNRDLTSAPRTSVYLSILPNSSCIANVTKTKDGGGAT